MSPRTAAVILVISMICVIVVIDVVLFRHYFWARLLANIAIVLLTCAIYLRFFHRA